MITIFETDFFDADIEFGETSGASVEQPTGMRKFNILAATAALAASTLLASSVSATEPNVRPDVMEQAASQSSMFRVQDIENSGAVKAADGRTLEALKSLIVHMESKDLSSGDDDGAFVTAQASRNARQFIDQIADEYELPKVAPDGDGGLVFAWETDGTPPVVVGFADDIIFAVQAPGTSRSSHFDEAPYSDAAPLHILRVLPKRTT